MRSMENMQSKKNTRSGVLCKIKNPTALLLIIITITTTIIVIIIIFIIIFITIIIIIRLFKKTVRFFRFLK